MIVCLISQIFRQLCLIKSSSEMFYCGQSIIYIFIHILISLLLSLPVHFLVLSSLFLSICPHHPLILSLPLSSFLFLSLPLSYSPFLPPPLSVSLFLSFPLSSSLFLFFPLSSSLFISIYLSSSLSSLFVPPSYLLCLVAALPSYNTLCQPGCQGRSRRYK